MNFCSCLGFAMGRKAPIELRAAKDAIFGAEVRRDDAIIVKVEIGWNDIAE